MEIIIGRKGDQPFTITDKAVSGKHLKLTTLPDGNVQVEDLGSSNGTFIDDVRVIKKVVSRNTVVRMGPTYTFCIKDVLPEVKQQSATTPQTGTRQTGTGNQEVPEFSIRHLRGIWDEYESEIARIRTESLKKGKYRLVPVMIGSVSGIFSPFIGAAAYVTVPISIVSFLFFFKTFTDKDTSYEDTKAAKDKLIMKYVCPNPKCGRTLPQQEYLILSQNNNCPYCRCKWIK